MLLAPLKSIINGSEREMKTNEPASLVHIQIYFPLRGVIIIIIIIIS